MAQQDKDRSVEATELLAGYLDLHDSGENRPVAEWQRLVHLTALGLLVEEIHERIEAVKHPDLGAALEESFLRR